jgi:replicative DNA helicase
MMMHPSAIEMAVEILEPRHFYRHAHQVLFSTLVLMYAAEVRVDPITLRTWLEENGEMRAMGDRGALLLADIYGQHALPINAARYAEVVLGRAMRRTTADTARRLLADAYDLSLSPADALGSAMRSIERATADRPESGAMSVDAFLAQQFPGGDWVAPGLLGRQDRVVVVGPEGAGKTMLSHQVGYTVAAGVHPFSVRTQVTPQRVLILDFENPTALLQRRLHKMTGIAAQCPEWNPANVVVHSRAQGVDMTNHREAFELTRIVSKAQPDLIIAGPVYKMITGASDQDAMGAHRRLAQWLDRMRAEMNCAVWIEAHAPLGGKDRVMRPEGSNLWSKWPEFGISLMRATTKAKGGLRGGALDVGQFRGHREEGRAWPTWLSRNPYPTGWPWVANYDSSVFAEPLDGGE